MKKLLVGLLTIASLSAIAHPLDTDKATAIDVGTTLSVAKDINIPSFNKIMYQDGEVYRYFSEVEKKPFCHVFATDRFEAEFQRDVRIPKGSQLNVVNVSSNGRRVVIHTETASRNLVHFDCYRSMKNGNGTGIPTIGEVKQSLSGVIILKLAEPVDI